MPNGQNIDWSVTAAWVQAVGSTAAIAAAIWLPIRKAHTDERRARRAAASIGDELIKRLANLERARELDLKELPSVEQMQVDLGGLRELMMKFPLERLDSNSIVDFLGLIGACRTGLDCWFDKGATKDQVIRGIQRASEIAKRHRNALR